MGTNDLHLGTRMLRKWYVPVLSKPWFSRPIGGLFRAFSGDDPDSVTEILVQFSMGLLVFRQLFDAYYRNFWKLFLATLYADFTQPLTQDDTVQGKVYDCVVIGIVQYHPGWTAHLVFVSNLLKGIIRLIIQLQHLSANQMKYEYLCHISPLSHCAFYSVILVFFFCT